MKTRYVTASSPHGTYWRIDTAPTTGHGLRVNGSYMSKGARKEFATKKFADKKQAVQYYENLDAFIGGHAVLVQKLRSL